MCGPVVPGGRTVSSDSPWRRVGLDAVMSRCACEYLVCVGGVCVCVCVVGRVRDPLVWSRGPRGNGEGRAAA